MRRVENGPPRELKDSLPLFQKARTLAARLRAVWSEVVADRSDQNQAALTERFYGDLHRIARRFFTSERAGHTLQPTAVVNEACMRILNQGLPEVPRDQKLALAARILQQVLIDHARKRDADKRGGGEGPLRLDLDQDILESDRTVIDFDAVHRAIEKLRALSERQAEVTTLRIFSGMAMDQVAAVLGLSKRSAEREWTVARAWLRRELGGSLGRVAEP
jgi:RNA polymerase sigma-70 factor (ECF subfamily)